METAKAIAGVALFFLEVCWFCNILSLFSKPHKWSELLMFPQLIWCILGIAGIECFYPQTEVQWNLVTYGYPILLLPVQIFACRKFLLLYKERKQENEKFLYLAISQLISMVMLSLLWIILGYALVWAFST